MINKKLLVLLAFTSQGMEANQDINIDNKLQSQDINNIDNQLQKQNSRKTLYIVLGGVAAVAIVGGAIWWFTKKDKTTEEQQPIEERAFKEQDIDNMFKLNTKEEWLKLLETKIGSHSDAIKKITAEIEKIENDSNLSQEQKKTKYMDIMKNNQFIQDMVLILIILLMNSFSLVLAKEFVSKYKQKLSNNPEMVKIFDLWLEVLPLKMKSQLINASGIPEMFHGCKKDELYKKLQKQVQDEKDQLENKEKELNTLMKNQSQNNINPVTPLTDEDQLAWRLVYRTMKVNTSLSILIYLFGHPVASFLSFEQALKVTTKNSTVIQNNRKFIKFIENECGLSSLGIKILD